MSPKKPCQHRCWYKSQHQQQKRYGAQRYAKERYGWIRYFDTIFEYIRSHHDKQQKSDRRNRAIEIIAAIAAVIAASAAIGSIVSFVILTTKTDETVNKAIGVARDQLAEAKTEQRPWIYADLVLAGRATRDPSGRIHVPARYEIHNTGHLPAMNVRPLYRGIDFQTIKDWKEMREIQRSECEPRGKSAETRNIRGTVVFPGQITFIPFDLTISGGFVTLDGEDSHAWHLPSIVGCFEYTVPDSSDIHQTRFGFAVQEKGQVPGEIASYCAPGILTPQDAMLDQSRRTCQIEPTSNLGRALRSESGIPRDMLEIVNIPDNSLFYAD